MTGADAPTLAKIYAEALAEAAEGKKSLPEVGAGLAALAEAWSSEKVLRAFFLSGAIPRATRRAALDRLRPVVGDLLVDFLLVLVRRGRGRFIPEVAKAFAAILDRRLGRVAVTLETATAPGPGELDRWTERLRAAIGHEPVLSHRVRPALIGGAVIRVGDTLADGSVRRRLNDLRDRALRASRERTSHALPA